jgi:hypothetical protein
MKTEDLYAKPRVPCLKNMGLGKGHCGLLDDWSEGPLCEKCQKIEDLEMILADREDLLKFIYSYINEFTVLHRLQKQVRNAVRLSYKNAKGE